MHINQNMVLRVRQQHIQYCFKFKTAYSQIRSSITVFSNISITSNPKSFIYNPSLLLNTSIHVCSCTPHPPLYVTEALHLVAQVQLLFNNRYSELAPYTTLANSYWVSFHEAYQCQGHAHSRYQLQLPYNSCRTFLTNHMWSTSCLNRHPYRNNFKKPGTFRPTADAYLV